MTIVTWFAWMQLLIQVLSLQIDGLGKNNILRLDDGVLKFFTYFPLKKKSKLVHYLTCIFTLKLH
jgi:hypothetical protein